MAVLRSGRPRASGFVIAAALVAAACGEDAAEGYGPAVVDTVHVRAMDVPSIVVAVGTVEADNHASVAAEVQGQVARILRDEGSAVGAGTPVIQLDTGPYGFAAQSARADLSRAQAQLNADEKLLQRYAQLLEAGAVDPATFENLEARVASGRAAVAQARAALNTAQWNVGKATVRAPFQGTIGRRHVQLGQYVDAQAVLFDVVDAQPVKIRFSIPETFAGQVDVGDDIRFSVRSDTISARIAQVDYVSPEIDADTRSFEATATYTNPDLAVRPGAYADVRLTTSMHENAPVVPEAALVSEGRDSYVFVLQDSVAMRRKVVIGTRVDGLVEILEGLRAGEIAIQAGQHGLRDGSPVAPAAREARPAIEPRG